MRVKIFLLGIFFTANISNTSAQVWSRIYYDIGNGGAAIGQCYDKGLLLVYNSDSNGLATIMKTDVNGNTLWSSVLNNDSFQYEGSDTTMDGGFILCGGNDPSGNPFENMGNPFILKLDACGQKEWSDVFKNNSQQMEFITGIQQLNDEGYIMCLEQEVSNSIPIISRLNSKGIPLWSLLFKNAEINNILVESDGNFLITCTNNNNTIPNACTLKITPDGKVLWIFNYKGDHGLGTWADITCKTKDKGYITLITTNSNNGDPVAVMIIKQDSSGKEQWIRGWGDSVSMPYSVNMINDSTDNGYILFESVPQTFTIKDSVKLVKIDSSAKVLTTKKYHYQDWIGGLTYSYNNRFLIGSDINLTNTSSAFHLWKINGALEQDSFDDSDHFVYDYKCKSAITDTVSLAGADTIVIDTNNMTIVDDSTITVRSGIAQVKQVVSNINLSVAPNPFTSTLSISFNLPQNQNILLTLTDITGKQIATLTNENQNAGQHIYTLDAEKYNIPAGIYFLRMVSGNDAVEEKVVRIK